jgi:hypothetical protein
VAEFISARPKRKSAGSQKVRGFMSGIASRLLPVCSALSTEFAVALAGADHRSLRLRICWATGPKTEEGKVRSARRGFKRGIREMLREWTRIFREREIALKKNQTTTI